MTKQYYDALGNLVRVIDTEGREIQKAYNSRSMVVAERDPLGRIAYHQYDGLGRKIAVTGPQGVELDSEAEYSGDSIALFSEIYRINPEYTSRVIYDSLSRQVRATDLLGTTTKITYDRVGNKYLEEITAGSTYSEAGSRQISYSYTPEYWLESMTRGSVDGLSYTVSYEYDKVGNQIKEQYPDFAAVGAGQNYTEYVYDGLDRLTEVVNSDGSRESYEYDEIGNLEKVTNGRDKVTLYEYNGLNSLSKVIEPGGIVTTYIYDPDGNLVQKNLANGLTTTYHYNRLNLLTEEVKVRAGDLMSYKYAYDGVGNLTASSDPNGNLTAVSYYADGMVKEQLHYAPEYPSMVVPDLNLVSTTAVPTNYIRDEQFGFEYDRMGNLLTVTANPTEELGSGGGRSPSGLAYTTSYDYDKLGRVIGESMTIDGDTGIGRSYLIGYEYYFTGDIKKITYPDGQEITYEYNELDQLSAVSGFADDLKDEQVKNFHYDPAGNLIRMSYNNHVETVITPDELTRPEWIKVNVPVTPDDGAGEIILQEALNLNYAYDANGNVTRRNNNLYTYDELDRLKTAEVDGALMVDTPSAMGYALEDYFVNANLNYQLTDLQVEFDYAASTIGLRLGSQKQIGRIELVPETVGSHRVVKQGISIFYRSVQDGDYIEVLPTEWYFDKDSSGKIIITFAPEISASEIKIHSNYDDRDIVTGDTENAGEFKLAEEVKVYGRYDRTKITYDYDNVGNRIEERYTDVDHRYDVKYSYDYYVGSNRLKSKTSEDGTGFKSTTDEFVAGILRIGNGEQLAYKYDQAGNTIAKGNSYSFTGEDVIFDTSGKVYWEYGYNARNRLMEVWKNGEEETQNVSQYWYDHNGKRIKVEEAGKVVYHVFNYLGQEIYEDNLTTNQQTLYVYALGKLIGKKDMHLAAGAGDGPVEVEDKYYYHQDNLGSTVMMTDESGQVVFEQDYTPFGQTLYQPGTVAKPTSGVEPGFGYTGQREEADIGLYYYNARYYDPEIGRFTREDEYQGDITRPQTLNLYSYVLQNPLKYVDPDGYSEYDWSMAMMYAMSPDPEASFNLDIEMKTTIISHTFRRIYDNVIFMGKEAYNFIAKPEETVNKYYDVTMNFIDVATSSAYYGITHPGDALEGYGMFFENIENNIEENPLWLAEKTGDLTGEILTNALLGYVGAKTVKLLDNITDSQRVVLNSLDNVDEIVEGMSNGGVLDSANFAQKTFKASSFSDEGIAYYSKIAGRDIVSVDDLVGAIKNGEISPSQIPIDYVVRDGNTLILNTRSSQALTQAGIPRNQWNAVNRTGQDLYEELLTGQLTRNKLSSEGISTVRPSNPK